MNYYSEKDIRDIVAKVVNSSLGEAPAAQSGKVADNGEGILVEVSARHVHLTVEDVETLFGKGYRLTPKKMLSQPGEFLSNERVRLVTDKGFMQNVAVLGPERKRTQVELSATDAKSLGVNVPVRLSGDLDGSGDSRGRGARRDHGVRKEKMKPPTPVVRPHAPADRYVRPAGKNTVALWVIPKSLIPLLILPAQSPARPKASTAPSAARCW